MTELTITVNVRNCQNVLLEALCVWCPTGVKVVYPGGVPKTLKTELSRTGRKAVSAGLNGKNCLKDTLRTPL